MLDTINEPKKSEINILPYVLQSVLNNVYKVSVDNLPKTVKIENLDEIKASLHNELNKASKELLKAIKGLKNDQYEKVLSEIKDNTSKTISEIKVSNLGDIKFPEPQEISFPEFPKDVNLSKETIDEIRKYFLNLGSHLAKYISKINVTPQVSVEVPSQPAPIVNVPEVDLEPILAGLAPLERLFNDDVEPIHVRVSGLENFIGEIQDSNRKLAAGFSSVSDVYVRDANGKKVFPLEEGGRVNVGASINGAGAPVVDSYTHKAINLAAGANQSLVSAPGANKQIWVYGIGFTVNVAGTVSFQDEDDTAITGIMQIGATGGMNSPPSGNFAMPMWKLATNKALEVDVVTSELDGWICYGIISV